ncbi:Arm DNA-binding domain-containing protein [Stenotrophomonas sp. CFBP 13725]|uniref:Arm DNA-binding domain-containing protein n=1 Tax=Stenotrophomonas sp. CFBP 13725 TaxID=2775297 RepID=UPI00177A841D|nr:Arm DNA-binding domain-containing protein [Stenotrophomonas sp. CFBP 13725]MBD8636711.1 hypothetical protein [Stenotrophomonas sp. CFBP 13725]
MAKVALQKYRLTQAQLRSLTMAERLQLDVAGRVVLVPNETGKPYRFGDATPGAPLGFGFYVGPMGAFYELRTQHNGVRRRLALGSVQELTLARAHELAGAQRHHIRQTGEDPRERVHTEAARQRARGKTVEEALKDYIAHLEDRVKRRKAKAGGVDGVKDSLARLQREDVGLADRAIVDLKDEDILAAWNKLRHSCMLLSNRLKPELKDWLTAKGKWWDLSREELVLRGLTGKAVELAYSAGLTATEQTMGNASRAVARVIAAERKAATQAERKAAIAYNPFEVLYELERYRSSRELADHYENAKVRNPLGTDTADTGNQTLPMVLKALVGRRDMQNGHNAVGVDYVLLTLLRGARRNESAKLRWYDSCSPEELDLRLVSWVWIAPSPDEKNPTTGLRGSQVRFHDTKNGQFQLLPVAYFAERILRWRADDSFMKTKVRTKELAKAQREGDAKAAEVHAWHLNNLRRWVSMWQERCLEEGAAVSGRLEALEAPDGDIQRYEDMKGGDDPYLEASLKKKYDKAMRELKQLQERKAVLTLASEKHKDRHSKELRTWLDDFYIGGSEAAKRDKDLRNAPTRISTMRERAVYRRLAFLERNQISLNDIGTPLEHARPAPEPTQSEPTPAPVGDVSWQKTRQVMADQEVFFTRLAERQRRKIERDRRKSVAIKKQLAGIERQTVVLGAGSTVALEDIDWETSRFPDREVSTRVDPEAMRNPAPAPRKRPGMLPTQPRLPTAPEPPRPPRWDQEIGM